MPARRGGCEPSAVLIADFEDAGPLTVDVQAELVALFRAQGGRVAWPRVQVEEEEEERGAEKEERGAEEAEERGAPPRVAVQFASPEAAARARSALHGTRLPGGGTLQVHAAHAVMGDPESPGASLALPQPGRVWLISPPGSPPAGWQPRPDPAPLVNYDLLCAIAQLGPGDKYELHAGTERTPSVVVHVCEGDAEAAAAAAAAAPKIEPTRRPEAAPPATAP